MRFIMRSILYILFILLAVNANAQITYDAKESMLAIEYLNRIRQDPPKYTDSTGTPGLRYAKPKLVLTVDSILMKVARIKATDMAENNYFDHINKQGEGINWMIHAHGYTLSEIFLRKKHFNSFESIAAGYSTGVANINTLILDKGYETPAHRQHLLGMTMAWADCTDIGVAIVHNPKSKYKYYCVIIIAKHE